MEAFGSTFKETIEAFGPIHLGKKKKVLAIGRIVISIMLVIVGVIILKQRGNAEVAYSLFGAVGGYWLK